MVRTKANYVPGAYRKVVASRAPREALGSSILSPILHRVRREKLKISVQEGIQFVYAQLRSVKKASESSSGCPLKILKKRTSFLPKKRDAAAKNSKEKSTSSAT